MVKRIIRLVTKSEVFLESKPNANSRDGETNYDVANTRVNYTLRAYLAGLQILRCGGTVAD